MTDLKKPPLGLKPRAVHDRQRLEEIHEAIDRYTSAGRTAPQAWIDERDELVARSVDRGPG